MKYYAIRAPFKKIVTDWYECEKLIKGVSGTEFKSFKSMTEAQNFMHGTTTKKTSKQDQQNILDLPYIGVRAFVDGSFNTSLKLYGGSVVFIDNAKNTSVTKTLTFKDDKPQFLKSRNIAGEIGATILAIKYAIDNEITELTIIHDYEGIAKWTDGSWRTDKTPIARYYDDFITSTKSKIKLKFIWVKGHTGVKYNELCDQLAKEACGIKKN